MTTGTSTARTTGTAAARRQLVTFEAAGELFAADIFAVERVLRYVTPRLLPNAAPWLRGVLAHGGMTIPLVDLRERLGLELVPPTETSRILVVAVGETRIGVTVDAVLAVRTVDAAAFEPPPAIYRGLAKEYLEGVVRQGGDIFVVLATDRLLTSTERIEMARVIEAGAGNG
ncbi:MAG: purine-binding chemotaxis protein CheW [Gemmatimonadetes bacterium]|jgi:purine-binding chemotaxis protein CheW|nr:purine-binding chemotaxis protein CheW [Gemmatimonadota bacterium]MBP7549478.1 purine-binding chemotaxis protein CheW [Gemmatimonadaceae bacterium]